MNTTFRLNSHVDVHYQSGSNNWEANIGNAIGNNSHVDVRLNGAHVDVLASAFHENHHNLAFA